MTLHRLKEFLGSGQFGIVYRGLLTVAEGDPEGGVKEVAVKTMENGASEEDRVKFLQEAAIMGQFNNPYIIKIYGIHTSSQPVRQLSHVHAHTMHIQPRLCFMTGITIIMGAVHDNL